ncbi:hypothetical protein [Caulobacter sp. NIBR1757]|uniref:hypothetical protein n=1 Tax=Caulobacter sp. NIBR1757 TaxID=3016000 RepID=UPI0022EFFDE9|nr:hypothetical protein [Caulobacter sp. NIBR1757]WGM39054.1 hypothetical protein AMEJIAPC_01967 [Caulobacter sp. NIBR1757]
MKKVWKYLPDAMAVFMAVIFLDSLRYKFTDHPKTQEIFGRLDGWAGVIGAPGLFGHTGLFSQYVIGSIELLASGLLILGLHPRFKHLQAGGALAGLPVMMGAVSFHLFTPLGIDPNNDGGGLFAAACTNLAFAAVLLLGFRRASLVELIRRVTEVVKPS